MKVYIVIHSGTDNSSIERVFFNEDQARSWADKHNTDLSCDDPALDDQVYIVQEHEVR